MMFNYKIQVNPIHTILKYGIYYDLNECRKLNNSGHELFIFKILSIAIDWNF